MSSFGLFRWPLKENKLLFFKREVADSIVMLFYKDIHNNYKNIHDNYKNIHNNFFFL